jgi:peptidoglycan/xylan/chitin deacetylase (PgdA/CDA1 family)
VNLLRPSARRRALLIVLPVLTVACGDSAPESDRSRTDSVSSKALRDSSAIGDGRAADVADTSRNDTGATGRVPNELGRIPVLMYHLIEDADGTYQVDRRHFREQLALLYTRGYRPVTMAQLRDRQINLAAGLSPVVLTFDDASPSQFRYVERNGALVVDSTSGWGILQAFSREHPDFPPVAVWCLLSAAEVGRSFFGDRGIEGQQSAWRFRKVQEVLKAGGELCNHTQWHMKLNRNTAPAVQEQIAKLALAIDSAVPGYRPRTMALPYGLWPKDRGLAFAGRWTNPKGGVTTSYRHEAVMMVGGGLLKSPHAPDFFDAGPGRVNVPREEVQTPKQFTALLDRLEKSRYVSDGNPATVARPATRSDD